MAPDELLNGADSTGAPSASGVVGPGGPVIQEALDGVVALLDLETMVNMFRGQSRDAWFHRAFRADEWWLYREDMPTATCVAGRSRTGIPASMPYIAGGRRSPGRGRGRRRSRESHRVHQDSATTRTQGAFAWTVDPGPGSIGAARQAFVAWLQLATSDDELLEDMSVVVSELASNALDAGDPADPGADVRAQLEGDVIDLVVSNRLPDDPDEIRRWDLEDPLRGGGRGLMIVRAYTDSLAVDSTGGTVSVHCTRRLDGAS